MAVFSGGVSALGATQNGDFSEWFCLVFLFLRTSGSSVSLNNSCDRIPIKGCSLKCCLAAVHAEAAEVTEKGRNCPASLTLTRNSPEKGDGMACFYFAKMEQRRKRNNSMEAEDGQSLRIWSFFCFLFLASRLSPRNGRKSPSSPPLLAYSRSRNYAPPDLDSAVRWVPGPPTGILSRSGRSLSRISPSPSCAGIRC